MQPKTEEFLYFLLWAASRLVQPTFRNLNDSFEGWAYRNGFRPQVEKLEELRLIERDAESASDRIYRLTEQGRIRALGGRDPQIQWARTWDGRWRLVLFDVPMRRKAHRERLRRYLHEHAFGCLQGSVWISPHPMHGECEVLSGGGVDVETLMLFEGRPAAGETNEEIVAGAWDFSDINRRYTRHLAVLDRCPAAKLKNAAAANSLRRWAGEERTAWLAAVRRDPLLPRRLLPPGYLGVRAWKRRQAVLREAGERLRSFSPLAADR